MMRERWGRLWMMDVKKYSFNCQTNFKLLSRNFFVYKKEVQTSSKKIQIHKNGWEFRRKKLKQWTGREKFILKVFAIFHHKIVRLLRQFI